MLTRPLGSLVLVLAASTSLWAAAAAHAAFAPCAPRARPGTSCQSVSVPLDRSGAVGGTIALHVERRATAARAGAGAGALFVLAGGPGQAATPFADSFQRVLAPALNNRDLIVFDQRGTGRSGRLDCPALGRARSLPVLDRSTEACARSLGAARGLYTSRDSADDIEAIRQSLGIDRIALYGVSYGTYTAMTYARRYPTHVEVLVLDSVIDPRGRDPFDRTTYAAIPRVLRAVCARRCQSITRDPAADLSQLITRLLRRPMRVTAFRSTGRPVTGTIGATDVLRIIEGADLDPLLRAQLPAALRSAVNGDAAPLGRMLLYGQGGRGTQTAATNESDALFLATTCEEEPLPWSRTSSLSERGRQDIAAIRRVPASAFVPWDRLTELELGSARPCLRWPDASAASPALTGPLPDVPALILDGEQDTRTPLEDARSVAALLPHAQLLSVPGTGHSVLGSDLGSCSQAAMRHFFAGQPVGQCASGQASIAPGPLAPRQFAALGVQRGVGGRLGRTLSAVRATLSDSVQQALRYALFGQPIHAGGLRGGELRGTLRGSRMTLKLRGIVYVPGVAVSGKLVIDLTAHAPPFARVSVSGRLPVHGSLIFAHGLISGHLGHRRLRIRSHAAVAAASSGWALRLRTLVPLRRAG